MTLLRLERDGQLELETPPLLRESWGSVTRVIDRETIAITTYKPN